MWVGLKENRLGARRAARAAAGEDVLHVLRAARDLEVLDEGRQARRAVRARVVDGRDLIEALRVEWRARLRIVHLGEVAAVARLRGEVVARALVDRHAEPVPEERRVGR